jgi:hypothetical protein
MRKRPGNNNPGRVSILSFLNISTMKKLILLAGLCCLQPALHAASPIYTLHNLAPTSANERAAAHFKAHYQDAENVSWFTLSNSNIYCASHKGDVVTRVFYDKHGNWRYTLLSYPGYELPKNVKATVTDYFKCYQVSSVTEVQSNETAPVYVVNIENDDNIKVIRVFGDEIQVQQELDKL